MRTATFSRMCGMGDILTDEYAFTRVIGPEVCHDTIGSIASRMAKVEAGRIDEQIRADKQIHDVDPKLSYESHAEAVRMYLAFKDYLEEKGYRAYTAHFDQFADDGRFKQLPLYAGVEPPGRGLRLRRGGRLHLRQHGGRRPRAGGNADANFTEMYTMDFAKKAIIFCHAGEGNWATHNRDKAVRLIDRYLGEGGLENPPTHIFTPQPGRATLTSLVYAGQRQVPAGAGAGRHPAQERPHRLRDALLLLAARRRH